MIQTYERALCQRFNVGEMRSFKIGLLMMHDYICRLNIIKCVRLKNLHEKVRVTTVSIVCGESKQHICVQAHHLESEQL